MAGINADVTGSTARWPAVPAEKQPSPFVFEAGARYWYSSGSIKFGFANGNPLFGNPTSTLDWSGLHAHSGEAFARLDHIPSGAFVKGVVGLGSIVDGRIEDRDFLTGQLEFSNTTSDVKDGNLRFAIVDLGWVYAPIHNLRFGVFAGYHYWNEKATAYGVLCNPTVLVLCPAGTVPVGFDTAVLVYEPTWHAVRIGFEGKYIIDNRWSVNGEISAIPYASLQNKDSHLLRQIPADLGPAPNIIADSNYAYGIEAELFVNYALTPNIEISGGVRYWGLTSRDGGVRFGPSFAIANSLNNFDQQRYGVLLQVKGRL
jgi:outer membrane protease